MLKCGAIWITLFWLITGARAQAPHFDFLTVSDGLASNVIFCVEQSADGFVWVGSSGGLQRYDGYEWKALEPLDGIPVRSLAQHPNGDIWIGTNSGGLWRYVSDVDTLQCLGPTTKGDSLFPFPGISSVFCDSHGQIWVAGASTLTRVRYEADTLVVEVCPADLDQDHLLFETKGVKVGEDAFGNLWVGFYYQGFCILSADQLTIPADSFRWQRQGVLKPGFPVDRAGVFRSDSAGAFWLGGNHSMIRLLPASLKAMGDTAAASVPNELGFESFQFFDRPDFGVSRQQSAHVTSMAIEEDGTTWFSTSYGIYRFDEATDNLEFFSLEEIGIPSNGFNALSHLYRDPSGQIWAGSIEGLGKPASHDQAFSHIELDPETKATLVRALLVDSHQQLWVGIENGGLAIFSPGEDQPYLQQTLSGPQAGLNYNFVMGLEEDPDGNIWVATYGGGLLRLQPQRDSRGQVTGFSSASYLPSRVPYAPNSYYIYGTLVDRNERLWVAAFEGVGYFLPDGMFRSFVLPVSNCLLEDQQGQIWIGTDEGLFFYDEKQDTVLRFELAEVQAPIAQRRIESLAETPDGTLWVGTLEGMWEVNREQGTVEVWGKSRGLPHSQVVAMSVDQEGQLWFSTLLGISCLSGGQIRNYGLKQGTFNPSFVARAVAQDESGRLFFGGKLGVVHFDPEELETSVAVPQLAWTGLRIFNQRVEPGDTLNDGRIWEQGLKQGKELVLTYRDRMVGFEFAGLGYRQVEGYRYAFRLEGFDQDWRYTDARQRIAIYTSLPSGTYTLRVKVAPANGDWSQSELALQVRVLPPWWRSTLAWILYGVLMAGLVYLVFRWRLNRLRREMKIQARIAEAKAQEREEVRARSARDFHDEAGGQLTKLSLYTGLIRQQQTQPETQPYLDKLETNIAALAQAMRDFIWVLDSRNDSLGETLVRIRSWAEELFEPARTDFRFQQELAVPSETPIPLLARRHLLFICKEALNNSLKYAQASEVHLRVKADGEVLSLHILDDGIGFHPDQLCRINGLENMRSRAEEIGAEFELESLPGMGTRVMIHMPIHPDG